jgi:ABC-type molybdate transport system substrate-binding protein
MTRDGSGTSDTGSLKGIIIVVFMIAVGAILFFTLRGSDSKPTPENASALASAASVASGAAARPSGGPTPAGQTEITMLYSSEKKEWIEAAASGFQKEHPDIKLTLKAQGSIALAQAIVDGKEKPTVVSPADTLVMNLLVSDWQTKNRTDLFATSGDDAPTPLVITPLVFVAWEDRADVLLKAAGGTITWKAIHKAVTSNEGWPAIKGKSEWGFVKLGHTDPTQSNSGLQALLSMTLEYHGKATGLVVADVLNPKYQEYIKQVEKGVAKFEVSTGQFMTDMIRFGPSKYDIAVVYENLAISQLANAQGRWGNLKLYYPATTLWSDHPVGLAKGDWVTPAQKAAGKVWIDYLRSRPMQELALSFGFRPGDPAVAIKTADANNPFTKLGAQGVKVEINPMAQPPDGQVIRSLMMMWSRVVAK